MWKFGIGYGIGWGRHYINWGKNKRWKLNPFFTGLLSEVTDEGGFATVGPFVPGER